MRKATAKGKLTAAETSTTFSPLLENAEYMGDPMARGHLLKVSLCGPKIPPLAIQEQFQLRPYDYYELRQNDNQEWCLTPVPELCRLAWILILTTVGHWLGWRGRCPVEPGDIEG